MIGVDMKKTVRNAAVSAFLLAFCAAGFADDKNTIYISPNNDGVQDALEIPMRISDKQIIVSWQLVIKDANGNVMRTIGNKVALPTKVNVKSFIKQLGASKKGVEVPEKVIWNGAMDNGETAPDGTYYWYISATDESGNVANTKSRTVIVDTKAPEIKVVQPGERIFGEGAKSTFKIKQSGSKEDKWIGSVKNNAGDVVKTFTWENRAPLDTVWDGTDNNGHFVADGVYSYEIKATDRAGNVSEPTSITNIIYSAEKPATNVYIAGNRYISPGTDSPKQIADFELTIPVPEKSSGNKLVAWSVEIVGTDGTVYYTLNQKKNGDIPPVKFGYDGRDENKNVLPQGKYRAVVKASYLNGYEPAVIKSPEFVIDVTKPSAQIGVSEKVFGAGAKDKVVISMLVENAGKFADVPAWQGEIYEKSTKKVVRSFDFGHYLPDSVSWNGFDSNGKLSADADYVFCLKATDLAGNSAVIESPDSFKLDTKAAQLLLSASESAFSPNGDKVKDVVVFTPVVKDADAIASYSFKICDSNGKVVLSNQAVKSGLPSSFVWDGKDQATKVICSDGSYKATLEIVSTNGSSAKADSQNVLLDTVAPSLQATVPWVCFSPDGDGNQDSIPVRVTNCSREELWKAQVLSAAGKVVKSYSWKGRIPSDSFAWDGSDESGNKAADGTYKLLISSTDGAGNSFATEVKDLKLDSRETKAYVTSENEGISPNADNFLDTQEFTIRTTVADGISSWKFSIRSENGTVVRSWSDKDSENLPAKIIWDGIDDNKKVAEGTFVGTLELAYSKGNKVNAVSAPFICTATPPALSVKTAPEFFSPDNDGTDDDLFIRLSGKTKAMIKNWSFQIDTPNGKPFWTTKGTTAITERIIWDGLSNVQKDKNGYAERVQSASDYPYTFRVTDNLGMTSEVRGIISVDVLVFRDGGVLKMAVPSIIFRSDEADFKTVEEGAKNGISAAQAENNERVISRIAEILNKFKDYKVKIVGHANRMTDLADEETVDNMKVWGKALQPLSAVRAEFVKTKLVKKGVTANRLSTEGKGGSEMIVDYKDKDNNWKNRRVEFILEK